MLNLLHAELFKLRKSTVLKVSFVISCICSITLAWISHNVAIGNIGVEVIASASGLGEAMIISLLGSLMVGVIICSDFETKTIHDTVICSNGRHEIVLSKIMVVALVIAFLMIPYVIVSIIGFSTGIEFANGVIPSVFANIMSENASVVVSVSSIMKIIAIALVEILVYIARISICIPIAFKSKKTAVVMGIGFAFSGLIDVVIGLINDISIVDKIISMTPFCREYMLIPMNTEIGTLLKIVGVCIIFIVIMILITYKLFKRDEIK